MTAKPKARKASAANGTDLDPVFAAIAEHKRLRKELAPREHLSNRQVSSGKKARGPARSSK